MTSPHATACLLGVLAAAVSAGEWPEPVVPLVRDDVQPAIDRQLAEAQQAVARELAAGKRYPALFKTPVRLKAADDQWGGMVELESRGLAVAAIAKDGLAGLPGLLDALNAAVGRPSGQRPSIPARSLKTLDDHVDHIAAVLMEAKALRDGAVVKLTPDNRRFMVAWPATMLKFFGPQIAFEQRALPLCNNDRAFCAFAALHTDWPKLLGAAKALSLLADPGYLAKLRAALRAAKPVAEQVEGVTGDVLLRKETPAGLILLGGAGRNTYSLEQPVAFLADLGGDDEYRGIVAASFDASHANSVVIDLGGNDLYEPKPFGLATGRLGVGLLLDVAGDDTYKLALGTGGAGLGGIGVLCDAEGDDTYAGSKWTQGVALGGVGLLLDLAGDDKHTSDGYAIGLGGPAGVAAVVDIAGSDSYQCGHKIPSGYNATDAPTAKPGDPEFQFDAFGLAMGLGRRISPPRQEALRYCLAGGVGMVLDLAGDDRYDSSNFSQACGYFFGAGLKLDLGGDDEHGAARYGHAAGAHFGMGLFVDYGGTDTYKSTGPTYNGGCGWDHSAFLFVEAGSGNDAYEWERSAGLGRADIGSWGVFAEMGGADRYVVGSGLGRASRTGLSVFYDRSGSDDYQGVRSPGKRQPANGAAHTNDPGGLFLDRED